MTWNFNMEEAPKGRTETREYVQGAKTVSRSVFVPDRIIAASADGVTVTPSSWMPDQGRWNMFNKDTPPIAWQPWPEHPGVSA